MQIKEFTSSEYSPSPDVIGKSYFEGLANCFWFNCMLVQIQPSPHYSALVQWLEYLVVAQRVRGSIPLCTANETIEAYHLSLIRSRKCSWSHEGSNPSVSTMIKRAKRNAGRTPLRSTTLSAVKI